MASNPPGSSPSSGGAIIQPTTPPKDPILVLVLNLLVAGGVGYIIIGQKMKGIVAIVAWVILIFVTCGIGSGILSIVTAIDGYFQALELQAGRPVGEWTFFKDHK
jgi:TM2 domain-containing membrane protein YozV